MSLPSVETLYEVCEATWPAARRWSMGALTLRDGQGGGKRVSAATLEGALSDVDLATAEAAMFKIGQTPLFQIRQGEDAFDQFLAEAGYQIVDPVNLYVARAKDLAYELPPRTIAIPSSEPLRIMQEIWARGGIGPERVAVMQRASLPRTSMISRLREKPAGTSFVAMHGGISMLHALEILPEFRREGLGKWAMRRAGYWTLSHGGDYVSVICTQANVAANALYRALAMTCVGSYHYRIKGKDS